MNILLSNDDGFNAPGLHSLIKAIQPLGNLTVVAPDTPQSGKSGAISVNRPLMITHHPEYNSAEVYSVNGTPVDCIKLALHTILPAPPDLVITGINHGTNSGNCALYSGTVGAALEAVTCGFPAIAFSLTHHSIKADFAPSLPWVRQITDQVIAKPLPSGICLNVNIPAKCNPLGFKVVRAARGHWTEEYRRYDDPSGIPFYWLTGRFLNLEPDCPETDEFWLARNFISIVPVTDDQTAFQAIDTIRQNFQKQ